MRARWLILLLGAMVGCAPRLSITPAVVNDADRQQATQYFIQAKVFEQQGNHLGAIVALRSAADLDPTSATVHAQLARNYHEIGDSRMASIYAERSLRLKPDQQGLRFQLVRWYDGLGDTVASARHIEALIDADPHNWQLYSHLSRLYMAMGKQDKINGLFDRLLNTPGTPTDVRVNIGYVISRSGRRGKAVDVFRAILAEDATVEDAWLGLGEALGADGEADEARHIYRQGARHVPESSLLIYELARAIETPDQLEPILDSESPTYLYRLGAAFSKDKRYKLATRVFERIVGREPQTVEGWLDLATHYLQMKDTDKAVGVLEQASSAMPDSLNLALALASTLERADRDEEATRVYERLAERGVVDTDLFFYWGIHHEEAGRWDEAIDAYRHGVVAQPDEPRLYIRWGIALSRQERWHEATERYTRAVAIDSTAADAHLHLGVALDRTGRHDEAIEHLDTARRFEPTSTTVLFYLGSVLERAARQTGSEDYFQRAVDSFEDLIEASPEDAYALNYLGYMFAERGIRLDEAVALLERAIAIEPDNTAFFDSIGWAHFRLGQLQIAEQYLRKAMAQMLIDNDGDEEEQAVILDHAGDIAAALGKQDEALDLWRRALDLTPGDDEIQRKLETP